MEIVRAILSLILIAVLAVVIMVIIWQFLEALGNIGIKFGVFSIYIINAVQGVLMGIGAGFGFVVAKRLFDITIFDK